MAREHSFRNPPLSDAVAIGRIGAHNARLWFRSGTPGRVAIEWEGEGGDSGRASAEIAHENDGDNTGAVEIPGSGRLRPLARYFYRARHEDGHILGEGNFVTAPASAAETPEKFSIALMSCHQPFDDNGEIMADASAMLRATQKCLREENVRLVLMVGDQMYSDYPGSLSLVNRDFFKVKAPPGRKELTDCNAEEVRRLYQERYRHFWNLPEMKAIQAEHPVYMIWDDHDIVDNWGSDPAHQEPPWKSVGEGARRAAFDYQASRVMDWQPLRAFDYPIVYGNQAIYIMDLRTERRVGRNGRLFSDEQQQRLCAFLEEHADKPFVHIVLSVPLIHLPRFLSQIVARMTPNGEDFSDRWSSWTHVRDRDAFLKLIHAHQQRHPKQRVVLLSGDIHIGCVHELRWQDESPHRLYQVVSSGYTHKTGPLIAFGSKNLIRLTRRVQTRDGQRVGRVRFFRGNARESRTGNPLGGLNFGLIEIASGDDGASAEARFRLYTHDGDEPVCVYRSPPVTGGKVP